MQENVLAPGARVVIRDAEWLIRRVDRTSTGGQAVSVVGLSELVKDREAVFLTEIDKNIQVLDPAETELVADTSNYYRDSLLYMESLLRQTPPTDEYLYSGYQGAIDQLPYQLDPAIQALKQPRQRILIADAVGLGKTIEVGILLTELMKRGKAKRILVLAVKSMLTQFQKELWCRFTIPLTHLDSIGIQRVRSHIPTNHNPFYHYDKAIISIDTLKQDAEYRTYLEDCSWDVIVIDEAQNVAERGSHSLRSRLAKLLSSRSDTLIMLSATPHDGKPGSFASLMNMLNPTAISHPEDYGPEDVKGLFIRRFKKDIKDQVATSFKDRKIAVAKCQATPVEEQIFDAFDCLTFSKLDQRRTAGKLFKTTLEKSLFSSPAACLQTIHNRISRLQNKNNPSYDKDVCSLQQLANQLQTVSLEHFSKYQKLLSVIRGTSHGIDWSGKNSKDRLVIFTERIETLKFLETNLKRDLALKDNQVAILHGSLSDIEQQEIVERFGDEADSLRLLIASDVASEGINLHFLSHKMIHFDIPWSLMVFQQRNGRIDRYGQKREPQIVYLVTESGNEKIKGDTRILEILIQKDEQAVKNIGDPCVFMGVYDIEQEEGITARAIEDGASTEDFEALLQKSAVDPLAILLGEDEVPTGQNTEETKRKISSLFPDDFSYTKEAIEYLRKDQPLQVYMDEMSQTMNLTAPKALEHRFAFLPKEIWPEKGVFILSADRELIKQEIVRCRQKDRESRGKAAWPGIQLLWEHHPILNWINDKVVATFRRQQAPVLTLPGALDGNGCIFILSGLIPNRKSHPLIHHWLGVKFIDGRYVDIMDFDQVLKKSSLHEKKFANQNRQLNIEGLKQMLTIAIEKTSEWISLCRREFEDVINAKLNEHYLELERLKKRRYVQLDFQFSRDGGPIPQRKLEKKERALREIDRIFEEYLKWIEDTMTTEDTPYLRVVAVLKGEG